MTNLLERAGSLSKRLMPGNAGWMLYSYVVGFAVQGLYFVVLARTLGAGAYGVFAGALALATTFSTLSGLGGGNVLVLMVSRARSSFRSQMGTALVYIALTAPVLAAVALLLGSFVSTRFWLTLVPLLLSELAFMRVLDVCYQAFQAHDELKLTAHFNVIAAVARLVAVVPFAISGGTSVVFWAWIYAACNVVLAMAVLAVVRRRFGGPVLRLASLRSTWRTGVFFSLGMGSRMVYTDGDKYVLNVFGMNAVAGEYAAAFRFVSMAFAPIQAIVYSANTRLFRGGADGYHGVWPVLKRIIIPAVVWAVAGWIALTACSGLLPIVLGPDYEASARMLPWLAPLLLIQAVHYSFGDALMGVGRQWLRGTAQGLVAVVSIALNIWLVPLFGWRGSAGAALVGGALLVLIILGLFVVGYKRETAKRARGVLHSPAEPVG